MWAKWILGGLGWAAMGPMGAVIGFFIGSTIERAVSQGGTQYLGQNHPTHYQTTESDFLVALLVLTASVIKADEQVKKNELDYIKEYLAKRFGKEKAQDMVLMLRDILKQEYSVRQVCLQVHQNTSYSTRLELLHYLFALSLSDGEMHSQELQLLNTISNYFGISIKDFETIKELFMPSSVRNPYTVLQVSRTDTDEEIKKAYKKLATKHHPDKVSHLGEQIREDAESKFQEINEAYQIIKKERGFK